ncbi:transposase [Streptomyces sp. NPDC002911]
MYTAVALTTGAGAGHHEATVGFALLAAEHEQVDAFGDTAYSTVHRKAREDAGHRLFLEPAPLRAAVPDGFCLDGFRIDTTLATVSRPAGRTHRPLPGGQHHRRKASFKDPCTPSPPRRRCTKARAGRLLTIRTHHGLLAAARDRTASDFDRQAAHRPWRSPFEPAVARLVHHGDRRLRYRGTIAADTWLHTRAAAPNLSRLIDPDSPAPTASGRSTRPPHRPRGRAACGRTAPQQDLHESSRR